MLNDVLGVVIGLVFVFLVLSLIGSGIQEAIAAVLGLRARKLEAGVRTLLSEAKDEAKKPQSNTTRFYGHALIQSLTGRRKPSYIPSREFALTVMDLFFPDASGGKKHGDDARETVEKKLANLPAGLKQSLTALWH